MKWIIFLFSLPNIVWAFQSSLSATYSDAESSVAIVNAASFKYYSKDIVYGGAPYGELAFLTSASSIELFHGAVEYNTGNSSLLSFDGSYTGVSARLYQGNIYFGVTSSTLEVDSQTLFDLDSRLIDFAVGFRMKDTNMIYGLYSMQSIDNYASSTELIESGFAVKSVLTDNVIYFQSTKITEDQNADVDIMVLQLQKYLDNNFYIALIYEDRDSKSLNDQREERGLSIGGAVNKSNAFSLSYSEVKNAFNGKANDIHFTMSFGF